MKFLSKLDQKRIGGKIALVRIDLNIEPGSPLGGHRVDAVVPTIKWLRKAGVHVVLLSHRGRPFLGEKRQKTIDRRLVKENNKLTLRSFAPILAKKVGEPVAFIPFEETFAKILPDRIRSRGVTMLENLRFHAGEERDDRVFARRLAKLGDIYVNDAFAVSHRANASVHAIAKFLPSYAGMCIEHEIGGLETVLRRPTRPITLIIGGTKISDKIGVMERFGKAADHILLAGGPANTFFAASKLPVGDSVVDATSLPFARKNLKNPKVILPVDVKVHGRRILDVGEQTSALFAAVIDKSRTIVWSGPLGLFEQRTYAHGTMELWRAIARNRKAVTVVGGGETVASLALLPDLKLPKNVFLSTGGGAMLDYLAGKKLPGLAALK